MNQHILFMFKENVLRLRTKAIPGIRKNIICLARKNFYTGIYPFFKFHNGIIVI